MSQMVDNTSMKIAAIALILASPLMGQYTPQQERLLDALIMVESNGNDKAVGDNGKALGCLQIWHIYWIDARMEGSHKDCFNRAYAKRCVARYMRRYARRAWEVDFNPEKIARIHNGGPKGHLKKATLRYWKKVQKELAK